MGDTADPRSVEERLRLKLAAVGEFAADLFNNERKTIRDAAYDECERLADDNQGCEHCGRISVIAAAIAKAREGGA